MTFPSPNPPDPELAKAIQDRMTRMNARIHGRPLVDDDPGDCDDGHDDLCGWADGEHDDLGGR